MLYCVCRVATCRGRCLYSDCKITKFFTNIDRHVPKYRHIHEFFRPVTSDSCALKSYTGVEAGGYLDRLENTYDLVYRYRPYLASENSRRVRYGIKDNFLNFWFRFIYKYRSAVEIGNLGYVREKVMADYSTFSGWILERYFRQMYRETGLYNLVTNYWEKDGSNEIDLVAVNEADREIVIGEVKRNARRIDLHGLEEKSRAIISKRKGWHIEFVALSLDDMS